MPADVRHGPATYRKGLRARLSEAQAALLTPLLGLSSAQLVSAAHPDGRSPLSILVEQADADTRSTAILQNFLGDDVTRTDETERVTTDGIPEGIGHFLAARRLLLDTFARIPDDDLQRQTGNGVSPAEIMERSYVDELQRTTELTRLAPRSTMPSLGSPELLLAALRAARKELLTTIALIAEDERWRCSLPDGISLRTHLSMLTSRDRELLRERELTPEVAEWPTVWQDLHATRQRLLAALRTLVDQDPDLYAHTCQLVDADRTLAASLRSLLRHYHRAKPE